jgi:hypothetical protein
MRRQAVPSYGKPMLKRWMRPTFPTDRDLGGLARAHADPASAKTGQDGREHHRPRPALRVPRSSRLPPITPRESPDSVRPLRGARTDGYRQHFLCPQHLNPFRQQ